MDAIWSVLGLEATQDTGKIRRAYQERIQEAEAENARLELFRAYKAALAYGETGRYVQGNQSAANTDADWAYYGGQMESGADLQRFADHPANREFLALYTGKRRRDPTAWRDFFTSSDFLDICREQDFTALLLEEVTAREDSVPPSREFLTWLSIAYQYLSRDMDGERQFRIANGADFDGLGDIFDIASMGPVPKRDMGNELAMRISFYEYIQLMSMADAGAWDDQTFGEAKHILGRYTLAYLRDRCEKREWNDVERHPAALRLLEHFFARDDVPEELFRMLWREIDGKSAVMGRPKVLYGKLRERILERVPDILENGDDNFRRIRQDFREFTRRCEGPDKGEEAADAFFAREDFQKALLNRRFITEQLMTYDWGNEQTPACFLRRLLAFYQAHPDAPHAGSMAERTERILREQKLRQQLEDRTAPVPPEVPGLSYRPFFRHWLNTAFRGAKAPGGESLALYLNKHLAYCPEWSLLFLGAEEGEIKPKCVKAELGGRELEAVFHLRYMDFCQDGTSLCAQRVWDWEQWEEAGGDGFFLFLPLVRAKEEQFGTVRAVLKERLASTAAPEEDREKIAGFLAGYVCCSEPSETPWRWYAETAERLYECAWWMEEERLYFFEENGEKRKVLDQYDGLSTQDQAQAMARRLLDEAVSPTNFHIPALPVLPEDIIAQPVGAPMLWLKNTGEDSEDFEDEEDSEDFEDGEDSEDLEYEKEREEARGKQLFANYGYPLEKGEVTAEALTELLAQFAEGKMRRLALHWGLDALVFVQHRESLTGGAVKYACLYFHLYKDIYFGLLSMPEVYETVDSNDVVYERFGLGHLPSYAIHHSPGSILQHLDKIFPDMGQEREPGMFADGHYLWCSKVSLNDGRQRFMIARQKLGGIPFEQYVLTKFSISQYPGAVEKLTLNREETILEIGRTNRGEVSMALVEFMQKKLIRLRLTWAAEALEGGPWHIVLLQDEGRFMMACLRDGKEIAEYYVADRLAYMKAEGKKYEKESFFGRTAASYLVHKDLNAIRNCLDLLLDDITDWPAITGEFGAFSYESGKNSRSYKEIRAELVIEESLESSGGDLT